MPHWPAMMKRPLAASYCDLSVPEFEREVMAGNLPQPVILGGREHWSKAQLDNALAVLSGEVQKDWRIGSPLYEVRQ
jgi:hypothetical protein